MKRIASPKGYVRVEAEALDTMIEDVHRIIRAAKEEYGERVNCMRLHLELKLRYPRARCWMTTDHVMTQIDDCLFDKHGLVSQRVDDPSDKLFRKAFRWGDTNTY